MPFVVDKWDTRINSGLVIFIGPRSPGPIYVSSLCNSLRNVCETLLMYVTPADETNSILTYKVNRTIQCNVAMQV